MKKQNKDKYQITSVNRKKTSQGNNYFDIMGVEVDTGLVVQCVYFGNTVPKRLIDIVERTTQSGTYQMAIIQPHTSRDKKTGRFTSYKRAVV